MSSLRLGVSGELLNRPLSSDPLLLSLSCSALQMHPLTDVRQMQGRKKTSISPARECVPWDISS